MDRYELRERLLRVWNTDGSWETLLDDVVREIEKQHVIVERGRAERLRFAAHVYFDEYENIVQPGDLEPFPEAE